MKDGTTRMAYKAEHAVDLDTDIVVAATVHPGTAADTATVIDTAIGNAALDASAGTAARARNDAGVQYPTPDGR